MIEQLDLAFLATIQTEFDKYHANNPHVYDLLVQLARKVKARGRKHYSIASLFEQVRWHFNFEVDTDDGFKISNNHRSRYARLIMEREPDLKGFFNTKTLRSD